MTSTLGWYPTRTPGGFILHLSATPEHLRAVRGLVEQTLTGAGADGDLTHAAKLVLSELCGNAVRACGDFVPLVAELEAEPGDGGRPEAVWVRLHDPQGGVRPRASAGRMDDPYAESGRGLALVELLAPGWDTTLTPVGKQIRCRVPLPGA
ncbi:hypothetical protein SRB5_66200 [Streptomyces sp. RB5]|uniref:Histidine kinase/HSP90-like ATPase domain-containing protein n=1 Tax=Streptomyces smaragdinus TaxID=2585196 RepID=A0A7K0CSI6_9ACTN|nr:ATP-binding protein [Streptomyces smaragdinus]MQY16421.1 hypothetical protein [Streptomyces smaragdinus]